jgi:uncharacterized protein YdhG (YjbR/CyaY superfamily)
MKNSYKSIDEYISLQPKDVQVILQKIRSTIKEVAPNATEKISYQMPTFYLNGNLIHFAAWKNHIGIYPMPKAIAKFKKELSIYQSSKGSIQLPLAKPISYELIKKIVKFRINEKK